MPLHRMLRGLLPPALACTVALAACRPRPNSSAQEADGLEELNQVQALLLQNLRSLNSKQQISDVVNLVMIGSQAGIAAAFAKAQWDEPDPRSVGADLKIAAAVAFNASYHKAPLSTQLLFDRGQDFAFEQQVHSPRTRHHARFWEAKGTTVIGKQVWLGTCSYDSSVDFSRVGGLHLTHRIAAKIDEERDYINAQLTSPDVQKRLDLDGVGPHDDLHNAENDLMITDGRVLVLVFAQ